LRPNRHSVYSQLAVELEKLRQKVAGVGLNAERGGRCNLARLEFNPKPLRGGTLPSLFAVLPCHVYDRDAHASGEEVCQDKLEHHNLSYRLGPGAQ